MKFAIIGDAHNDWKSLEKVLKDSDGRVDKLFQIGDLAGGRYAHWFRHGGLDRCVELVQKYGVIVVRGNHESETTGKYNRHISKDTQRFLEALPNHHSFDGMPDILFCHTPPSGRNRVYFPWQFAQEMEIMKKEFPHLNIFFYGHTHVSSIVSQECSNGNIIQRILPLNPGTYNIENGHRYLINPGSIYGMFKHPGYIIFDSGNKQLHFRVI